MGPSPAGSLRRNPAEQAPGASVLRSATLVVHGGLLPPCTRAPRAGTVEWDWGAAVGAQWTPTAVIQGVPCTSRVFARSFGAVREVRDASRSASHAWPEPDRRSRLLLRRLGLER